MFVIDFKNKSCSKVKGKIKFSTEIKVLKGSYHFRHLGFATNLAAL